jgi:hypothetical protein
MSLLLSLSELSPLKYRSPDECCHIPRPLSFIIYAFHGGFDLLDIEMLQDLGTYEDRKIRNIEKCRNNFSKFGS